MKKGVDQQRKPQPGSKCRSAVTISRSQAQLAFAREIKANKGGFRQK